MNHYHFDTRSTEAGERAQCWSAINRDFFGPLGVECLDDGPLDAQMSAFEVGPLRLFRITAPAHRVQRGTTRDIWPIDDKYKMVLQLGGQAQIRQRERSARLGAGEWSLYDPRVPYSITNFERSDLLALQIPREQLRGFKVPALHTREAASSDVVGLHAVLGSFLRALAGQLESLPEGVAQPLAETILGLLASTLAAHQAERSAYATLPDVLKARVRLYVQTRLADPELGIDSIARAMRCSKRYLHRVFEDESTTLERYIWASRLERCRDALADPAARRRSISQTAYACGFKSSAHFCRLFKAHYGMAPREFRAQAGATWH